MKSITPGDMGGHLINKDVPLSTIVSFLTWFKENPFAWAEYQIGLQRLFDSNEKGLSPSEVAIKVKPALFIPSEFYNCLALAAVIKCPEWGEVFNFKEAS